MCSFLILIIDGIVHMLSLIFSMLIYIKEWRTIKWWWNDDNKVDEYALKIMMVYYILLLLLLYYHIIIIIIIYINSNSILKIDKSWKPWKYERRQC